MSSLFILHMINTGRKDVLNLTLTLSYLQMKVQHRDATYLYLALL